MPWPHRRSSRSAVANFPASPETFPSARAALQSPPRPPHAPARIGAACAEFMFTVWWAPGPASRCRRSTADKKTPPAKGDACRSCRAWQSALNIRHAVRACPAHEGKAPSGSVNRSGTNPSPASAGALRLVLVRRRVRRLRRRLRRLRLRASGLLCPNRSLARRLFRSARLRRLHLSGTLPRAGRPAQSFVSSRLRSARGLRTKGVPRFLKIAQRLANTRCTSTPFHIHAAEALLHHMHRFEIAVHQQRIAPQLKRRFPKRAASGKKVAQNIPRIGMHLHYPIYDRPRLLRGIAGLLRPFGLTIVCHHTSVGVLPRAAFRGPTSAGAM